MGVSIRDLVPNFKVPESRLTIIGFDHKDKYWQKHYRCRCDCGTEFLVIGTHVASGHTKSCGCIAKRANGNSASKEYNSLQGAIRRCYNPNNPKYKNYGGRGISVCQRYRGADGVDNLIQDVGSKPGPEFSLGRIDNDGNYCPGNLRWETNRQQSNNKTTNRMITYNGETLTLSEWERKTGVSSTTIAYRLNVGWPIGEAMETAPHATKNKYIEFNGQTKSLEEWSEITDISKPNLIYRINAGWDIEKTFTTPTNQYNRRK